MPDEKNTEYVSNVLSVTRDQLSRALSAAAELEALLIIERKRSDELESKNKKLEKEISSLKTEEQAE